MHKCSVVSLLPNPSCWGAGGAGRDRNRHGELGWDVTDGTKGRAWTKSNQEVMTDR